MLLLAWSGGVKAFLVRNETLLSNGCGYEFPGADNVGARWTNPPSP